ncbi:hypothetical protein BDB00DRAFT_839500 [Zychaea mexicana]|uniref:uncharacterized protein n=1 Tax=Zychaea mexicana TaxID=64656 RepID=UPI0022FEE51F|nr:uncharacterized protein BDB00DRAFT_839500 [Zychaea mexicana]KAI9490075.1 hypothetical protein BDB00DRAFT_839500 [Zychaea mexicana]
MKFSVAAASALLVSAFAGMASADAYADAIAEWCDGLEIVEPNENTIAVAGSVTKITATREPNDKQKTVSGLDLYSVDSDGQAKYIQNVWQGNFTLNQRATITDDIPANVTAGLYYYRAWITNLMDGGKHGPDCIETSHNFKVTSGVHQHPNGISYYTESLDDVQFYHPDYFRGCFGLKVTTPAKGKTYNVGDHITVTANRDKASQTAVLKSIDLYKSTEKNKAVFVENAWEGKERFTDSFTLKDHFKPAKKEDIDESATYYYTLTVTSNKSKDEDCTFHSEGFKIKDTN